MFTTGRIRCKSGPGGGGFRAGAHLGGSSLSGASQRSSCCLWRCRTAPAFSSPPRNTGGKICPDVWNKKNSSVHRGVRHRQTHAPRHLSRSAWTGGCSGPTERSWGRTGGPPLAAGTSESQLDSVLHVQCVFQLRVRRALRYGKYRKSTCRFLKTSPGLLRFTSHVLMCADSHSWRIESSCSMLDKYCFSKGKTRRTANDFMIVVILYKLQRHLDSSLKKGSKFTHQPHDYFKETKEFSDLYFCPHQPRLQLLYTVWICCSSNGEKKVHYFNLKNNLLYIFVLYFSA